MNEINDWKELMEWNLIEHTAAANLIENYKIHSFNRQGKSYKNKKPTVKRLPTLYEISPVNKLAIQLNILIPVGIAMTDVVAVN